MDRSNLSTLFRTLDDSGTRTFLVAALVSVLASGCAAHATRDVDKADSQSVAQSAEVAQDQKLQLAFTGIQQLTDGELEDASLTFNEGLKKAPRNATLHFLNGLTYHRLSEQGDYSYVELAEVGYQVSQRFDDKNWWTFYFSGALALKSKDYESARDSFVQALLLDRNNLSAMRGLAIASYFLGDMDVTLAAAKQMLGARPVDSGALQLAVLSAASMGRFHESETYYSRLNAVSASQGDAEWVQQRVQDWRVEYTASNGDFQANNSQTSTSDAATTTNDSSNATKNDYSDTAQTLIDVVILRSDQAAATRKGINLLDGLSFTFSQTTKLTSRLVDEKSPDILRQTSGLDPALVFPRISSRVLAIPSVNYSLNIFNTIEDQNSVIARPSLTAMEGKTSTFFSGVELTIGLTGNFSSGSLQFTEIGVTLNVTPEEIGEKDVLLDILAERDSLEPAPLNAFEQVVQTTKNKVSASARVEYDKTLVLSGITVEESGSQQNKVPGLGDVTGLQWLFNVRQKAQTQSSVIFLLTPRRVGTFKGLTGATAENIPERSKSLEAILQSWGHSDASDPNLNYILKGVQNDWIRQHIRPSDVSLQGMASDAEIKGVLNELTRRLKEHRAVI